MFSQYSWGDFFKFVLLLAVPYYAYVAWKYYREDIRDWFSRSKDKEQPAPVPVDEEEEVDANEFFSSKTYSTDEAEPTPSSSTSTSQQIAPEPDEKIETVETEEVGVVDQPVVQAQAHTTQERTDVEISEGVVVTQEATGFDLGLSATPVLPTERSLADVLNAAKRLSVDNQGAYLPANQSDQQAAELAGTLNEQKDLASVLSGVAFTR